MEQPEKTKGELEIEKAEQLKILQGATEAANALLTRKNKVTGVEITKEETQTKNKEPLKKIGNLTFGSEEELYKYLDENAVDKENNLNMEFFDYKENIWPEAATIASINKWTKNFKDKKREMNQSNEASAKEATNDNVEEKISEEEYKEFVDKNNVSTEILNRIAEKGRNGEKLSLREQDILSNKIKEIEEIQKNHSESNKVKIEKEDEGKEIKVEVGVEKSSENTENKISPEKIENLKEILESLEKNAKEKLESGPLSSKMKGLAIKTIDKIENFGKGEEGAKGFAKRFAKMAINLALIGLISSGSVKWLSELGVGTASALSGGVTSYLGRKMVIGLGIGGAMELSANKIPDKIKKWMPLILTGVLSGASIGVSFATGGIAPAAMVGLSSAAGYASSKFIKNRFTNEQIIKKEEAAKQKFRERIGSGDTFGVEEIEKEYNKILKKYENQRIWGKVLDGATKLSVGSLVSGLSLEASGFTHNLSHHHNVATENQKETEIKHDNHTNEKTEHIQPKIEHKAETVVLIEHKPTSVEFSSKGGIQTILDLRGKIRNDYPDLTKAPASVQEFMNANPTQEAIKLGFYNPSDPSGAESIMILKGSTLEFDDHGNLSFHDIKTGQEHSLIEMKDNAETIEKYHGKMFDSDHSGAKAEHIVYKVPEQVDPVTGQHIIHTSPDNLSDNNYPLMHQVDPVIGQHVTHTETSATDQYKLQHQVDPVTGKPVVGENTNHNNSNTDGKVEHGAALSPRELEKVNTTYKENVTHLFHNNKDKYAWERVKEKTPEDLLKLEKENVSMYETYKPLTSYIHKLEELTGLRPETKSLLVPIDETNSQFIVRAMQKAQEMGQLDKVKL